MVICLFLVVLYVDFKHFVQSIFIGESCHVFSLFVLPILYIISVSQNKVLLFFIFLILESTFLLVRKSFCVSCLFSLVLYADFKHFIQRNFIGGKLSHVLYQFFTWFLLAKMMFCHFLCWPFHLRSLINCFVFHNCLTVWKKACGLFHCDFLYFKVEFWSNCENLL